MHSVTTPNVPSTVTNETCDKCGPAVAAKIIVVLAGGELAFCNHCFDAQRDALIKAGASVAAISPDSELVAV